MVISLALISTAAHSQSKGIPTLIIKSMETRGHDMNGQANQISTILKSTGNYDIVDFKPLNSEDLDTSILSLSGYQLVILAGKHQNWPGKFKKQFESYLIPQNDWAWVVLHSWLELISKIITK